MGNMLKETIVFNKTSIEIILGGFIPQGFTSSNLISFNRVKYDWMKRCKAETDCNHKHPIPYIVLLDAMSNNVLMYERSDSGSEKRLSGRLSIGLGGHIEHEDYNNHSCKNMFEATAQRELEEELSGLYLISPIKFKGIVNWDGDSVGQVHLGIVYVGYIKPHTESQIRPLNKEIKYCSMESIAKLVFTETLNERLETWSKLILPAFL